VLGGVEKRPAHFDCFGLHEWAMVYRTDTPRHTLPLRLGRAGTDAVVEAHQLKCTHFDAYRFFTQPARPLNLTVLTREGQTANDQAGCVHVAMDLYKWATKLGPLVPGELLLDTFALAREARRLDMEASPYDCRELGFGVVPIETAEGKAEYVRRQRKLAEDAAPLRHRLVALLERVQHG
ncbi:3-methyladenine DNA glycosylase, partial [Corynebacterium hadale]|nr:3-methyladenine DNA glycosylase [Corynebacterium hadale]